MNASWQDFAAIGLVIVAGVFLARRLYRFARHRSSGCGSCAACPVDADPKEKTLVSIESLVEKKGDKSN
ncbi:MAG: hypothetical protein IIA67_01610 [Planctomycetes bacterium]|nr:hypothetical protein [Planctomycetota bacterium]